MDRWRVGAVWEVQMFFSILTKNKTKKTHKQVLETQHVKTSGKQRKEILSYSAWSWVHARLKRTSAGPSLQVMKPVISTWAMSRHSTICKHCQEHVTLVLFILKCTCTTACACITSILIIHCSDKWWLIAAMLCGEHSGDSLVL